jgi:hypothetical protein
MKRVFTLRERGLSPARQSYVIICAVDFDEIAANMRQRADLCRQSSD